MTSIPEEQRFSINASILAQAVQDGVQTLYNQGFKTVNPKLIESVAMVITLFDKDYLIQGFIENSHQFCWDKIKERSENFFIDEANNIFRYLPIDKVNLFKDLFLTKDANGNNVVPESLKEQIWCLFDAMVKISIKYVHKKRLPISHSVNGTLRRAYRAPFFNDVDINHHSKVWGLELEFPPEL
jgi:hypothetical protein